MLQFGQGFAPLETRVHPARTHYHPALQFGQGFAPLETPESLCDPLLKLRGFNSARGLHPWRQRPVPFRPTSVPTLQFGQGFAPLETLAKKLANVVMFNASIRPGVCTSGDIFYIVVVIGCFSRFNSARGLHPWRLSMARCGVIGYTRLQFGQGFAPLETSHVANRQSFRIARLQFGQGFAPLETSS